MNYNAELSKIVPFLFFFCNHIYYCLFYMKYVIQFNTQIVSNNQTYFYNEIKFNHDKCTSWINANIYKLFYNGYSIIIGILKLNFKMEPANAILMEMLFKQM